MKVVHALRVSGKSARVVLDRLPAKSQEIVDRRVRRYTDHAREAVVRQVASRVRSEQTGRIRYIGLPDGHTLNLHAALPIPEGSPADGADLLLIRDKERHRVPARLYRLSAREMLIDVSAVLGGALGGVPLTAGRWEIRVRVTAGGRPVRSYELEGPSRTRPVSGPTQAPPTCPVTGVRYRVGHSPLGLARLVVGRPALHAEVDHVELRHSHVDVFFRPVGAHPAMAVSVEADGDRRSVVLSPRALPDGTGRFAFRVPFDTMLENVPGDEGRTWTFRARVGGRRSVIGHRLAGVRSPSTVYRSRPLLVATEGGGLVHVRTSYSSRGHLRMACTVVKPARRPGAVS